MADTDFTTEKSTGESLLPRWATQETYKKRLVDAQCVLLNTLATVTIVFMNKSVLSDPQLRNCQLMIAAWHFAATFLVLLASTHRSWRLFKPVHIPVIQILPLSIFFASFLILNNLSLTYNPIGFYQLSKILTTPSVVLINFLVFKQMIPAFKLAAVLITCLGVAIVSSASVFSNPLGMLIATAAFTSTACYQIWIGKQMTALDVDAPQLLLNQSGIACLLLVPLSVLFDTIPDFTQIPLNTLYTLVGAGIVASLLNLSQFLIIGRTSALTFNVVSNVKMVSILGLGWYTEGKVFSMLDVLGIALAFGGAWFYASRKS